jgi:hypothetical protein
MPRFAPVTTAVVTDLHVDEDLHRSAALEVGERVLGLAQRHDPGDQKIGGDGAVVQQFDGLLEVDPLVDARTKNGEFTPEDPLKVDLPRCRMDGDHDESAAHLGQVRGAENRGGRTRDLEHDVGAGATCPLRHPVDLVSLTGVEGLEAELPDLRATVGVELYHHYFATEFASDGCDEHSDRAATDHDDTVALLHIAASNVVHRHRGWFDESGVVESQCGRERDEHLGGDVPVALQRARRVDADEVQVLADVLITRQAGGTGAVPVERHHRDRVSLLPVGDVVTNR